MDPTLQPGIRIAQVFLETARFEHRADHLSFPPETKVAPDVELSFDTGVAKDKKSGRVRIRVRTPELATDLYAFDLQLTALLQQIEGEENFPLDKYVGTNGWAMLFPFVRENLASLTSRGRFGPVWLSPVNIMAIAANAGTAEHKTLPKAPDTD